MRYLLVGLGLVLLAGILAGVKGFQIAKLMAMGKEMEKAGPPPETVGSATTRQEAWESTLSAVGSISGVRSVSVSAEAPGLVTKIRFQSGQVASEGQVLVELDANVERAQLAAARARRELAVANEKRARVLAEGNVISRAQVDEIEAQLQTASTEYEALRAQVERKVVRAPFRGRLGIRAVNVGQYLAPGTTVTTLDALGAPFVDFSLPQEALGAIAVGLPVRITFEGKDAEPITGEITAIAPTVDPTTRNVRIRASIPAQKGAPRPGMFANVQVVTPKQAAVVAVPATAIVHATYGDSVFVIEPKKPGSPGMDKTPDGKPVRIARQQFVRVGQARGDFVAVTKGLAPGQQVVSAGAFKLRNGSPIVVDDRVKAVPQQDPRPENR